MNNMDVTALIPAAIAFAGVLVGALVSLMGTFVLERRREKRAIQGLAAALLAEIKAILHVEETHNFRAMYQETLDRIKQEEDVAMPNIRYDTNPARSVYYTNLPRIGDLPSPIPEMLVQLSYVFEVVATDRMCMDKGEWNRQEPPQRISFLEHHLETYDGFITLAHEAKGHLEVASK